MVDGIVANRAHFRVFRKLWRRSVETGCRLARNRPKTQGPIALDLFTKSFSYDHIYHITRLTLIKYDETVYQIYFLAPTLRPLAELFRVEFAFENEPSCDVSRRLFFARPIAGAAVEYHSCLASLCNP